MDLNSPATKVRRNAATGAFVHCYAPLRIYLYAAGYPQDGLNFMARILLDPAHRLAGNWSLFEPWPDWESADFILHPTDLNYHEGREAVVLERLDRLAGRPERHLFIDHRDAPDLFGCAQSVHLKASLSRRQVTARTIAIPYIEAVDDFRWYLTKPEPLEFDLCFIGETTPFRSRLISALRERIPRNHLQLTEDFYHGPLLSRFLNRGNGSASAANKDAMRQRYISVMRRSRFALAPCGFGRNSFRFFEALSLGVPPILVSSDCALPFADVVDYESFSLILPAEVEAAARSISEFVDGTSAEVRDAMAAKARAAYDMFMSFDAAPIELYRRLRSIIS